VGEGGQNHPADVLEVQERLNAIATDAGGPIQPLAEDGICGGYTKAAILKFQRRWPELVKDGRIDPDKNTWKKLVSLSVEFEIASTGTPLPKVAASGAKPSQKKIAARYSRRSDVPDRNDAHYPVPRILSHPVA